MTDYNLDDIMDRLPVLQKAALATLSPAVSCDAVNYWPYTQEAFPYWWNRIDSMRIGTDLSGDADVHTYTITMALVIAHLQSGYKGQPTQTAYLYIPAVLRYFTDHRTLKDGVTYTTEPDFLYPEEGGAVITSIPNGTRPIINAGIEGAEIAVLFTIDVPLLWYVD